MSRRRVMNDDLSIALVDAMAKICSVFLFVIAGRLINYGGNSRLGKSSYYYKGLRC